MWDRPLLASLFGLDYVWELFHPPAKRRWGWYVRPSCSAIDLSAGIEPKIDRAAVRVDVLNLW